MTPSEKIKICSTCKNSKWNKDCGIVCGLTGAKPDFDLNCEHYLKDENAVESVKQNESASYSEINTNNDEALKGASWFKTISILSIINIGLNFVGIQFIFSLSTTQLIQGAIKYDLINPVLGVLSILILPIFFMWTWWLTAQKGYKLCYNIGWAVYLLDTLLLAYIFFLDTSSTHILVDIVIHILVLFAFLRIFSVNLSKNNSKPFAWGAEKICYFLLALATVIVPARPIASIYSVINNAKQMEASEMAVDEIDRELQAVNAMCPIELYGFGSLQKVERKANSIVITGTINCAKDENCNPIFWASLAESGRVNILKNMVTKIDRWPLNFDMVFRLYDTNSCFLYDIVITPDDYKAAKANPQSLDNVVIDIDTWLQFMNSLCPIKNDEVATVLRVEKNSEAIVFQIRIDGIEYEDFRSFLRANPDVVTTQKLEAIKDSRYDANLDACFKQGYNIVYSYCDSNSKLLYEVVITPDEYKAAKALLK